MDSKLCDGNDGGRNGRSSRNNLFILYAVCNSVLNGEEPIDINLYDIEKCFDTLWNEDVINSLYELGLRNDILNLIYLENRQASISVKSAHGDTERSNIKDTILQGTVWGPVQCFAHLDEIGKLAYYNEHILYKYKGVTIPPLQQVDDILTISKCGDSNSIILNNIINSQIERKK